MAGLTPMSEIRRGEAAVVVCVESGGMERRFLDIGLIPGTGIKCLGVSPLGDPSAYLIRGAVIAIRRRDAEKVLTVREDS